MQEHENCLTCLTSAKYELTTGTADYKEQLENSPPNLPLPHDSLLEKAFADFLAQPWLISNIWACSRFVSVFLEMKYFLGDLVEEIMIISKPSSLSSPSKNSDYGR